MKQNLFSILTIFFILASGGNAAGQLTLSDSLVLSLQFSGNTADSSGNQNDAIGVGSIFTTDRFGNPNSAIFLDGQDDYVIITDSQNLKPQFPITVAAWVKIEDFDRNLVVWNDWQEDVYHGIWLNIVNGEVSVAYGDGGPVAPGSRRAKLGESSIPLQTWTHLTGIIRGPTDMEVYINGRNDCGTYNGSGGPLAYSDSSGRMGQVDPFATPNTNFDFFHGSIDDVRLYSRELSEDEISELAGVSPLQNRTDSICLGDTIQLISPNGYNGYSWLPSGSLSCNSCPNPLATPDSTTTYQVLLIKAPGCTDDLSFTVHVDDCCSGDLGSLFEGISEPQCPEDSLGSFFIQGTNGTPPYQYSLDSISFSSSGQFNSLSPGTYKIWIRDSLDCEFDTTITLNSPPGVISTQFSFTGETAFGANDGSAKAIPSGGNGGPWSYLWSNGATTDSIVGLAPGVYVVTVTDQLGCSHTDSVSILGARVSLEKEIAEELFSIFPNPTNGKITLNLPHQKSMRVTCLNLLGQELSSWNISPGSDNIELELQVEPGMYFILGETNEQKKTVMISVR